MSTSLLLVLAAISSGIFAIIIVSLLAWLVLPMEQVMDMLPRRQAKQ